jgi:hypothetical protein
MLKHCLLILALAAAHAAAAPRSTQAAAGRYESWKSAAAAALAARADANSLATAAALRYRTSPGAGPSVAGQSAADLAAHAAELAPQNASIGWMHLQICSGTAACDIRDAATVMRWVDAENAAAWLQTLAAAQKDRDTTEVDRVLADMAHGARFDFYWNRIVVLMVDALEAAHNTLPGGYAATDAARLSTADDIASGMVIPPITALAEACRESGAAPERRELCLRLSKTMQRSDTVAAQLAGFSIERRLRAPDSREARAIAERKHVLEWRVAAAAKFDDPLLPWTRNARARARLSEMRARAREEDVCIAILRQHRVALDPPQAHP